MGFIIGVQFRGAAQRRFSLKPRTGAQQHGAQCPPRGSIVRGSLHQTPVKADGFRIVALPVRVIAAQGQNGFEGVLQAP